MASLTSLGVGLTAAFTLSAPALAVPVCAAGSPNTTTVAPGDGSTTYTVPASGVSALHIVAQGGQGANEGGTAYGGNLAAGGAGAVVATDLGVSGSEVLTVAAGSAASGHTGGQTGGASGGAGGGSGGADGGTGGGTVVFGGGGAGSTVYDGATLLVVAGGGGGAAYPYYLDTGYFANGGSAAANTGSHAAGVVTSGGNGVDSGDGTDQGGTGGSSIPGTGGAGVAAGSPGSGMIGGDGGASVYGGAGGGGGGYAGGGGGGSGGWHAGGGAGSSYSAAAYKLSSGTGDGSVTLSWEDPSITSTDHTTFYVGSAGSFTVCTTGVPTDTITAGSGFPAWATFTDHGDGTATISGTPPSTAGGNYTFTITAANGNGTDATQPFTLSVPPAVTGVSSTDANGTAFKAGGSVTLTVSFTEAVTVTGTPQLALNSGGTASYVSGSGTSTLTFGYTVAAGENANPLDYGSTSALSLNGGTIQDADGNDAVLTLPTTGSGDGLYDKGLVIDTTNPTITLTTPADNGVYTQGSTVDADYTCTDPGGSGVASCVGTVADGSPIDTSNGPHSFTVTATDDAGNQAIDTVSYTAAALLNTVGTTCDGYYVGTGNSVLVPRGATCTLLPGTHVRHEIRVQGGGSLDMKGATIDGSVTVDGTATICDSAVGRDVYADGPVTIGGPGCAGNTIGANLTVEGARGGVTVEGNEVGRDIRILHNRAGVTVEDNTAGHNLLVESNASPTEVVGNHADHDANCRSNGGQTGSGNTAGYSNSCPA